MRVFRVSGSFEVYTQRACRIKDDGAQWVGVEGLSCFRVWGLRFKVQGLGPWVVGVSLLSHGSLWVFHVGISDQTPT